MEDLESRRLLSLFTFFGHFWPYYPRVPQVTPVKAQAPAKTTTTTAKSTTQSTSTPADQSDPMTLLEQENFTSNVSPSSPDAFDSVTGTLYSEAGGPTFNTSDGTIGVSADPEQLPTNAASTNPISARWNLGTGGKASAAQDGGFMGGWFRFTFTDPDDVSNHVSQLMSVGNATLFLNSNQQLELYPGVAPGVGTVPLNQWIFIGVAWVYNPTAKTFSYQIYTKQPGQSLDSIYTSPVQSVSAPPTSAVLADQPSVGTGGGGRWEGRVGTFFIASISSFSDVAMPSSVIDPVVQPLWFGVNPVNGNDNNSGIIIPIFASNGTTVIGFAPGSAPWKTLERVNTALAYSGMFAENVAWENASNGTPVDETQSATALEAEIVSGAVIRNPLIDNLVIDTASGPFSIADSGGIDDNGGIQLNTNVNLSGFGSNVGGLTNVGNLQAFIPIAKNSWTLAPGATYTYETTNTAINAVLWQNMLWMNHILGSSYSAVAAQLESTPGSFWTDGTTMYVHPFGNTDPATDSNVYERSPGGTDSNAIGISVNVNDAYVYNLAIGGTAGADMADNDPIGLWTIGADAGGLGYFDNLYLYYSSKHAFVCADSGSNDRLIVNSVDCEQGSPYAGSGGQYMFTSYNGTADATGDQNLYINCSATHSAGLIGSTAGTTLLNQGTFYSHNNGGSDQFSIVTLIDCRFDGSISSTNSIENLVVTDTTCASIGSAATWLVADRDTTTFAIIRGSGMITNSIMNSKWIFGDGTGVNDLTGTATYIGDVFDARSATTIDHEPSYFDGAETTSANLTIRDCIFLTTVSVPVVDNFQSSDTLDMDHNLYDTAAAALVSTNFNSGNGISNYSLAQWQRLGYDAGSMAVADSAMNINLTTYVSFAQTPITFDVGELDDMTGEVFLDRKTIGAYEYVPPTPIYSPPPGSGLSTTGGYTPPPGAGLS